MTRVALIGCLAVWLGAAIPATAQTALPLSRVIDDAITQNPSLAVTRAAARQADAERRTVRSEWMPRIAFTEAWQRSTQPVAGFGSLLNARRFTVADFAIDRLNRPGDVDAFVRRVGVSQVLFDAGHTTAALRTARHRTSAAEARTRAAITALAVSVTEAYGRVVIAQSAVESAKAAVTWATEDLARATARRDAGTATDADVLAMSVHAADMRQRQLQAESDLIVARATVNHLAGAAVDRAFSAVLPPTDSTVGELPALLAVARAERPEIVEAALAMAMAETGIRDARGSWLPTVAAGANYEWNGTSFRTRESAWTVGAELRWSISLGGGESARIAAARAALDGATAAKAAAEQAVDLDVLTARQRWLTARARVEIGRLSVTDADESLRITRERYAAGLATVRDVLGATATSLAAITARTAHDVDIVIAWAALQRAIGRTAFAAIQ